MKKKIENIHKIYLNLIIKHEFIKVFIFKIFEFVIYYCQLLIY